MRSMPYFKFDPREFILRDWLALDRTVLANERTILAYTRTALTLILAGLTLIRFFGPDVWATMGYLSLTLGILLWVIGFRRYLFQLGIYRSMTLAENREAGTVIHTSRGG